MSKTATKTDEPEVTPLTDANDPMLGTARGRAAQVTAKAAAKAAASSNAGTSGSALTGQGGVVVAGTSGAALTNQGGVVANGDPLNVTVTNLPNARTFANLTALQADPTKGNTFYTTPVFTTGQYVVIGDLSRCYYKTAAWSAGVYA